MLKPVDPESGDIYIVFNPLPPPGYRPVRDADGIIAANASAPRGRHLTTAEVAGYCSVDRVRCSWPRHCSARPNSRCSWLDIHRGGHSAAGDVPASSAERCRNL